MADRLETTSALAYLKSDPKKNVRENTRIKYTLLANYALDHGINPIDLVALMYFETRGTMSTSVQNTGNKHQKGTMATGLIQFMPSTARGLGTTVNSLKNMSTGEQLQYVHKYFKNAGLLKKKKITAEDLYCTVTAPSNINKSSNTVVYRRGQEAYRMNKGWDVNKDGLIRKKEFGLIVKNYRPTAEKMLGYVFGAQAVNKWKAHLS